MLLSPSRAWLSALVGLLLCACSGGPISDFPNASGGDDGKPSSGPDDSRGDDASAPPPAAESDAGAPIDSADPDAGGAHDGGAPDGDADGGVPDAEVGPDAEVDGGTCTPSSDGRPDSCYGDYCGTSLTALGASVSAEGACSAAADLALVCDGAFARTVAECAEQSVGAENPGATLKTCAAESESLADASDACLRCYVAEVSCMVSNCLAECLNGSGEVCAACRESSCRAEFVSCSGLPQP